MIRCAAAEDSLGRDEEMDLEGAAEVGGGAHQDVSFDQVLELVRDEDLQGLHEPREVVAHFDMHQLRQVHA